MTLSSEIVASLKNEKNNQFRKVLDFENARPNRKGKRTVQCELCNGNFEAVIGIITHERSRRGREGCNSQTNPET